VLGLRLAQSEAVVIPTEVTDLAAKREQMRKLGKFVEADQVRLEVEKMGFKIKDTPMGTKIYK
jgi:cysteinyl-tRNA synthetase